MMEAIADNQKATLSNSSSKLEPVTNKVLVTADHDPAAEDSKDPVPVLVKQTVIRLKRRIEDSPSKILVVSYKRSRGEFDKSVKDASCDNDNEPTTSEASLKDDSVCSKILRLVGTVPGEESDNNNIAATVKNAIVSSASNGGADSRANDSRPSFRKDIKAKTTNIAEKTRDRFKRSTEENRFKIIASRRGVSTDQMKAQEWDPENDLLKLLDLVPENEPDAEAPKKKVRPDGFEPGSITCNGKPMVKGVTPDEKGYVYDLYLSNDPCIEEFMCGQFVSVEEGDGDLEFGEYREKAEDEDFMEDDEDSNAEDNWRNDYPDSEEEGLRDDEGVYGYGAAGGDLDLGTTLKGLNMKGDSSSDDDIIYGIDDDNDGMSFENKYSRYKRRVMQEYEDEVVSVSEESDYD